MASMESFARRAAHHGITQAGGDPTRDPERYDEQPGYFDQAAERQAFWTRYDWLRAHAMNLARERAVQR